MKNARLFSKGFLYAPTSVEPSKYCHAVKAKLLAPRSNTLGFTIKFNKSNRRMVVVLGCYISPSTVFWRIVRISVDPVKRHINWTLAHIFKKVYKAIFTRPSVTNFYAPTAIILVTLVRRILTSKNHTSVGVIGRAFAPHVFRTRVSVVNHETLHSFFNTHEDMITHARTGVKYV